MMGERREERQVPNYLSQKRGIGKGAPVLEEG